MIKPCPQTDEFKSCLQGVFESIRDGLAKGDFGEGYVTPRMEPMFLDLMQITGPELNINMTNLYVKGPTTYKVVNIK